MKRITLLSILVAAISLPVFAAGPVTLSVTYNWFGSDAHAPFMKWALEDFSARYPNIKLDLNQVPSDKYRAKVRADFMAKAATDILLWYGGAETVDFAKQNMLMDIGPSLTNADSFIKGVLANMSYEKGYFGLPLCENFFALYINKDIYKSKGLDYPKNYDELLSQVKVLKSAGLIPIMMPGQNHPAIAAHFYSYIANQTTKEGDFDKASYGLIPYTSAGFVKAAEIVGELQKAGAFDPNIDGIPMASVEDMFSKGQGAMYFIGIWRIGALPKELREKMHPILFPAVKGFTEDSAVFTGQAEMGWIFNSSLEKDKEKLAAAKTFLSYFASKEIYQKHVELTDTAIPVVNGVDVSKASYAVRASEVLVAKGVARPFLFFFQSPAQQRTNNEIMWNIINGRGSVQENIARLAAIPANIR